MMFRTDTVSMNIGFAALNVDMGDRLTIDLNGYSLETEEQMRLDR
jgi:hypothetical protein